MPTQDDYTALAHEMELLGTDLHIQAGSLAAVVDPALLTGGSIGRLVTRTADQSTRDPAPAPFVSAPLPTSAGGAPTPAVGTPNCWTGSMPR